jgi:hypothetical protein
MSMLACMLQETLDEYTEYTETISFPRILLGLRFSGFNGSIDHPPVLRFRTPGPMAINSSLFPSVTSC